MRFIHIVVALSLASLLAACSSAPPEAQIPDVEQETGNVTLRIFVYQQDWAMGQVAAVFEQRHPNVRVQQVVANPADLQLDNMLPSKIAEGTLDLVDGDSSLLAENLLLPLDSYLQRDGVDTKPFGSVLDGLRWEGKLYDLPYSVSQQFLVLNQALFKQAGVPLPDHPLTWDEFRELAQRVAGEGHYGFATGYPEGLVSMWMQQASIASKANATPADLRQALQFFGSMALSDKSLQPPPPRTTVGAWREVEFLAGRAAMTITPPFIIKSMEIRGKAPWDAVPIPTLQSIRGSAPTYTVSFGIPINSRHRELAWQFLAFLCGPEGQAIWAREGGMPIYKTPAVKRAWLEQQPAPPAGMAGVFDLPWSMQPRVGLKQVEKAPRYDPVQVPANQVLTGEKSVEEAVKAWEKTKH